MSVAQKPEAAALMRMPSFLNSLAYCTVSAFSAALDGAYVYAADAGGPASGSLVMVSEAVWLLRLTMRGGHHGAGPRRSMKVPVGPSASIIASLTIESVPSVTVNWPVCLFMSVAAHLWLAISPGVARLNLISGSAWAYRTVIMFSAAFDEL
jgi:hypothetical protein